VNRDTNDFDISLLLSTKIISFFMFFTSFVTFVYWCCYLQIEPKHMFGWERVTSVMSNEVLQ